jgi:Rab GDP dissociation inhibitor
MDQDFDVDVIVLGTGFKECILSGLLSVQGKKVLHMDRNNYYGGECASLNLKSLYEKFKSPETKVDEAKLGKSKEYNVDLCPKFVMACGNLVKLLLISKVSHYLQFKSVAGSFVFKDGKVHKVPASPSEAMGTSLMGIFQKNNCRSFLQWVADYEHDNPATHKKMNAKEKTAAEVFKYFSLDDNTQAFVGHAMALYADDEYLNKPFFDCLERIKLYAFSVAKYGSSPYLYPLYGLAGLPEGFSRMASIYGGLYMLRTAPDEILYNENGTVAGVRVGDYVTWTFHDPLPYHSRLPDASNSLVILATFLELRRSRKSVKYPRPF